MSGWDTNKKEHTNKTLAKKNMRGFSIHFSLFESKLFLGYNKTTFLTSYMSTRHWPIDLSSNGLTLTFILAKLLERVNNKNFNVKVKNSKSIKLLVVKCEIGGKDWSKYKRFSYFVG